MQIKGDKSASVQSLKSFGCFANTDGFKKFPDIERVTINERFMKMAPLCILTPTIAAITQLFIVNKVQLTRSTLILTLGFIPASHSLVNSGRYPRCRIVNEW